LAVLILARPAMAAVAVEAAVAEGAEAEEGAAVAVELLSARHHQ